MPAMPSIMSADFQPAMAMYVNASAASDAENFVCAPISRALSRIAESSLSVAPEIACTFDIPLSKSAVVLTAAAPIPATAMDTGITALPMSSILPPAFCSCPPICPIFSNA